MSEQPAPHTGSTWHCLSGGGEMGALMRAHDWSDSPLGAVEQWPRSLLTVVGLMLSSRYPILVLWGPELRQLYNDAFRPILGDSKHPVTLGRAAHETWAEAWHVIGAMLHGVLATGEAVAAENMAVPIERRGYLEETYFTFSYDPIRDDEGRVAGVFVVCQETTRQVLQERRVHLVRDLMAQAASARTVVDAAHAAGEVLSAHRADLPFFLLCLKDKRGTLRLSCAAGLSTDLNTARRTLEQTEFASWSTDQVHAAGGLLLLGEVAERLAPLSLGKRGATQAAVVQLSRPGPAEALGYLIAGLHPRRPLDDDQRAFLAMVGAQLAASFLNAGAYEDAHERAQEAVRVERARPEEAQRQLAEAERATRSREQTLAIVSH
ncbi:MAG: two-component hybrid sensor and regulator, partial [Myxococcaceae bacterium]|nr:two-component hybrid sensor and regulator [Myxococcaceae bacterium]